MSDKDLHRHVENLQRLLGIREAELDRYQARYEATYIKLVKSRLLSKTYREELQKASKGMRRLHNRNAKLKNDVTTLRSWVDEKRGEETTL